MHILLDLDLSKKTGSLRAYKINFGNVLQCGKNDVLLNQTWCYFSFIFIIEDITWIIKNAIGIVQLQVGT